jgi:uncharacterized cupredoxin-like copper-binding protein
MVAASLALLCGCGHTQVAATDGILQVSLSEYRVTPQSVQAKPGPLILVVHNYGRLTHDLVISLNGHPEASTRPIAPGQTTQLVVTLPAGRYLMASTILSDQDLGAYGTLTVT